MNPVLVARLAGALAAATALAAACGGGGQTAAPSASSCSGNFSKPSQLNLAYQVIPNGDPIVKHERWLEKDLSGVQINWRQFDSGAQVNTAVASSSVDMGLAGSSPVASGLSRGLGYEVPWIYDIEGQNEALVVKKSSGITSVKGLAGKTVGVPFVSTTHYSLLSALRLNGVSDSQLKILDMQPPDALAAWKRGDIQAAYIWEPTLSKMVQDGGTVILTSAEMAKKGYVTGDLAVLRKPFAKQYPCVVQTWVKEESRAVDLYRSKPDQAAADVAAEFGISKQEAAAQMKELIWLSGKEQIQGQWLGTKGHPGGLAEDLYKTAQYLLQQKVVQQLPNQSTYTDSVNPAYVQQAVGS